MASEASFTHASTFDTTPVTADAGGSGALALGGIECATKTDCGESVLAATAGSAGAARCTPASVTTDRVGGVPGGDGALISADDGWSATSLGTAIVFNDDRFGFLRVVTDAGDDQSVPDLLTGAVSLAVVVGSGVTVGEAVVGSGPESSPADESPPVAVDPEVLLDVEPDVDVDPEVPLDVVLLDDEPDVDVDPDESGEDFEPDESDEDADPASGSANATPGVVATANPTPKATAKAPTRPMYFAVPILVFVRCACPTVMAPSPASRVLGVFEPMVSTVIVASSGGNKSTIRSGRPKTIGQNAYISA